MNTYAKHTKKNNQKHCITHISFSFLNCTRVQWRAKSKQQTANSKLQQLQSIQKIRWNKIDWMRCTPKDREKWSERRRRRRREKFSQNSIFTSDSEKCNTKNPFMLIENWIYYVQCSLNISVQVVLKCTRNEWMDVLRRNWKWNHWIACKSRRKKNSKENYYEFNLRKDSTSSKNRMKYAIKRNIANGGWNLNRHIFGIWNKC